MLFSGCSITGGVISFNYSIRDRRNESEADLEIWEGVGQNFPSHHLSSFSRLSLSSRIIRSLSASFASGPTILLEGLGERCNLPRRVLWRRKK